MDALDVGRVWHDAASALADDAGGLASTAQAWRTATESLDPHHHRFPLDPNRDEQLMQALQTLEQHQLQQDLLTWYLDSVTDAFEHVSLAVQQHLERFKLDPRPEIVAQLLDGIGACMQRWQRPIEWLWPTSAPLAAYRRQFLSTLFSILPLEFSAALTFYLRSLLASTVPPALDSSDTASPLALSTLIAILDRYEPLLFGLIYEAIEAKVTTACRGHWRLRQLPDVLTWLSEGVMTWVSSIYARAVEGGQTEARKMLKPTFARFEYHVHKTMGLLRTSELFDMIVNYPLSEPGLKDLEICLHKTDQRESLIKQLSATMSARLLQPGVVTSFIIEVYISTIRSLRMLDAQGVLLSRVAGPIRQHLRGREDTIRCIVSSLTEEGSQLVKELAATTDAPQVHDAQDEAEDYNDPKWTPDPIDATVDFRKSKGSDIIQSLVSIYDTKDVFIKELQVRLAQQLLAIRDYAFENEMKNVQTLKFRFGEASLQGCEVMIKDLQDSKHIDARIHQVTSSVMHATILSRLFWPSFQAAPLRLPGQLAEIRSAYEQSFVQLKPDKKLRWLPQQGSVNLTIELADRSITLDTTPLQASIVELFSRQDTWELDDLAIELELTDTTIVKNSLYFWNNQGVIKNVEGEIWKLLEERDLTQDVVVAHVIEEEQSAVQSVEAQQVEQMRIFWQYIQGMLTNLKAMPLPRIHSMLTMLVPTYKGHTTDQLNAFLLAMSHEGLVEKVGPDWKIIKN